MKYLTYVEREYIKLLLKQAINALEVEEDHNAYNMIQKIKEVMDV